MLRRSKRFSLLMALIFTLTMIFPWGGIVFAAEDNVAISSSYNYVKADDNVGAGTIRVEKDGWVSGTNYIIVQLRLPEGVEFNSKSNAKTKATSWVTSSVGGAVYAVDAESNYFEVKVTGDAVKNAADDAELVKFDFSNANAKLDIDDDFTGNLDVAVDVIGMDVDGSNESILWTDNDDVTIAKVSEGDVTVTVGSTKKVSVGAGEEVADITLEESMAGAFAADEIVTLEIETDGVEFSSVNPDITRLTVDSTSAGLGVQTKDAEAVFYKVKITGQSESLPGKIKFDNIMLDIAPNVTGEIEISITSNSDADLDETVTVAAVGDSDLTVTVDEDTGMEEYMRMASINELWEIKIKTNGEYSQGDKVTITLPDSFEFYKKAVKNLPIGDYVDCLGTFNGDRSIWLEVNASGDGKDEITLSNLFVAALPGAQYGDINVEIGGDIGQATVKAGFVKPAAMIKPEQKYVARGHNQLAGNITFTETDKDAVKDGMKLHMVLPNGVKFASTPTVTVNGEEIDDVDVGPGEYDKSVCRFIIDKSSSSKIDTLVVSDIKYDIEDWFRPGEVIKVKLGGNDPKADDNFNLLYESFLKFMTIDSWDNFQFKSEADETIAEVPNAIVVDPNEVTASFCLDDEGVYVENGRTMVQVNLLTEVLGLQKSWDDVTKTAYFLKDGKVVAFPIGQNRIYINKVEIPLEQGAKIIDNYTCVSLRGVEMAFGGELKWDNETKTATFLFNK